jgi:curved DNA-binding protein CbpA
MRLNRAEEIDYYEELGVERNAAPETIRDSFRALVRLLHPDQQTDEYLKSTAEKQLRKINRIYAVLSDPDKRRDYDELLALPFVPPIAFTPVHNITAKALVTRMVWVGLAMLGVAIVIWVATDPPASPMFGSAPADRAPVTQKQAPQKSSQRQQQSQQLSKTLPQPAARDVPEPQSDEIARLEDELRATRSERDEAKREIARLKDSQVAARPFRPPPASAAPLRPVSPLTATSTSMADLAPPHIVPTTPRPVPAPALSPVNPPPRAAKPPGADPHQFAGFWFFAKPSQPPRNRNLYPPEFIEALLTEQNGVVHGRYRSRYQIVDRAISPDVNFEFTGSPGGPVLTCAWSGQGGAKGQITLHMTDENSIKVDWTASELGSEQALASGTATLTRRLD